MEMTFFRERLLMLGIPFMAIAELASVSPARVSLYFRSPELVRGPVRTKITEAVESAIAFAELWNEQKRLTSCAEALCIDWRNITAVRKALATVVKENGLQRVSAASGARNEFFGATV